jgi:enoyl-CoA hydratase/carnithine racemase
MTYETILYDVEDNILTITLNRPEKLNAFNRQMLFELIDAIDRADEDDDVRAIILTGAGRGYCAGADLSAGADSFDVSSRYPGEDAENWRDGGGRFTLRLYECKKPVIGAINGPAVGIGATMTLPMDVRLASTEARMGFVFTKRGVVLEACSSWFLPKVVGMSQALEWVISGRVFDAEEALAGGLVKKVLPANELLPTARALAKEFATNTSSISVALCRQMLWRMAGADHPMEAHKIDSAGIRTLGKLPDCQEGVVSFLEKRAPDFPMKVSKDMPDYYPWWEERAFE